MTYTSCTSVDGSGWYWCATAVVLSGDGAARIVNWDYCVVKQGKNVSYFAFEKLIKEPHFQH